MKELNITPNNIRFKPEIVNLFIKLFIDLRCNKKINLIVKIKNLYY